jgi:Ca2+:H+ antiporter
MTLTVFGLVLLAFTVSSTGTSLAPRHTALLIAMSVGLYAIFVAIQTLRHRDDFVGHGAAATNGRDNARTHHALRLHSAGYHGLLLLAYVLPLVLLANQIAVPVHYGMSVLGVPAALGGLLVAVLILSPEALAAIRAALANQLQRSMDLALRTPLSSISLTIPAVLGIGFLANRTIVLGLGPAAMTLLWLTLGVSMLTFARERPSALLGAVHAILFLVYLTLIFMK